MKIIENHWIGSSASSLDAYGNFVQTLTRFITEMQQPASATIYMQSWRRLSTHIKMVRWDTVGTRLGTTGTHNRQHRKEKERVARSAAGCLLKIATAHTALRFLMKKEPWAHGGHGHRRNNWSTSPCYPPASLRQWALRATSAGQNKWAGTWSYTMSWHLIIFNDFQWFSMIFELCL